MTSAIAISSGTFEQETTTVLTRLRAAIGRALSRFSVDGSFKSRDLQKQLGIDVRLSWQLSRIICSEDPMTITPHIPSPALLNKVLQAVRARGVSEESISAVTEAYAAFEAHVVRYAEDRQSFDAMMARIVGGDVDMQLELAHRRAIFEGHRYVWGIELEAYIAARILFPAPKKPGLINTIQLRSKYGLKKLDSSIPIMVDRKKHHLPTPDAQEPTQIPLDAAAWERYGIPILPAFCSQPEIPLEVRMDHENIPNVIWKNDAIGKPSSVNLTFGDVEQRVTLLNCNGGLLGYNASITFATPTRVAIQDVLVHRPSLGSIQYELSRWGHIGHMVEQYTPTGLLIAPQLPCRERVSFLGTGEAATHCAEIPYYSSMLTYACQKMNLNIEEMDVYRVRLEYPLLDTMIVSSITFNESAGWPRKS